MSVSQAAELENFHHYVGKQLASKSTSSMSPEEVVARWREEQETLTAIREGLADIEAGRTMTIEEFDRDFRKRHGLEEIR